MSVRWLVVLVLVGVCLLAGGVAWIYPPAALILLGALCVAVALYVEVRDT